MAEVEVRQSVFSRVIADKYDAHLSPHTYEVHVCESCGCIFLTNSEGDQGWYPDRFEMVGSDKNGCTDSCACHDIPYMVDQDGNATEF